MDADTTSLTPVLTPIEIVTPQVKKTGRPCEYCANKDWILKQTQDYINKGTTEDKQKPLFLNELAVVVLKKHRETINEWANKKNDQGELEHPEFSDMIKVLEEIQELQLQKRVLGRYNPTGAIFLLKTKHGYIETEKKVVEENKTVNLNVNTLLTKVYGQPELEPGSIT